ncbi:MAG TPA: PQQ-dependent sugar dehydrogenase [Thermoanaerobaculia bacterium]|nr:PQQ-dependent sugar dehydrogenase [Thermoanaerobaculia bacterium]
MKSAAIALLLLAGACRDAGTPAPAPAQPQPARGEEPAPQVTEVARGLEVPWSIAFAPDGRIFVTERPGRIRVIEDGALRSQPLHTIPNVSSRSEEGLMGLALHPDFGQNRLLYVCYATNRGGRMIDEVVRFRDTGIALTDAATILTGIPAARFHAGCRLAFGPDRKLYVTTGDATEGRIAQDLKSLGGKILRLEDDGSIPEDNPFAGSPVWSYGHRNPQGLAWDPVRGLLFSTEHGPSGFDGAPGGDEVNIIEPGKNYGWPLISHAETRPGMEAPLLEYTPACAPASAAFWKNDLLFGCLRGERVQRVVLDPQDRRKVVSQERLFTEYGRIREVVAGPDGALYFSTSNRDGRGNPAASDDRIFRVEP